jgi:hypothetical protein
VTAGPGRDVVTTASITLAHATRPFRSGVVLLRYRPA